MVDKPTPRLWCLFYGCFYFAANRMWFHTILSFVLAICTVGISWLIYPIFVRELLIKHLRKQGWRLVSP